MGNSASGYVWLTAAFPVVGCLLFVLLHQSKKIKTRRLQKEGLERLLNLKSLLMLVQRHRGMSYSVLMGDSALRNDITQVEQNISRCNEQLQSLGQHPRHRDYWLSFFDHWSRLQRNNLTLAAENNREQHNQIISVLLYLIEDVAEYARLSELCEDPLQHIWRDLPRTAEWIGQARVLGSGMLAAGHYERVDKIRISFIRSKLAGYIESERIQGSRLNELVTVIDQQLLQDEQQKLSSKAYFDLSTQAMEPLFQSMDQGLKKLGNRLAA